MFRKRGKNNMTENSKVTIIKDNLRERETDNINQIIKTIREKIDNLRNKYRNNRKVKRTNI